MLVCFWDLLNQNVVLFCAGNPEGKNQNLATFF